MADSVEVKLGADVGDAKSSMQDAQASIAASLQGIQSALTKFTTTHSDAVNRAIQNNANLSRSFLELKGSATGGFNAIAGVVERVRGVLLSLTAVLAGGAIFKAATDAALNFEDSVRKLEIVFGMNAAAAEKMAFQLKLAGVEEDTYARMAAMVGQRIRVQSDEFDRLKVVIKDAHGNFLPMDQILQNIYKRMQDFKAGTDQDLFVMDLAGRRAVQFASDMERLNRVEGEAAKVAEQYAGSMSADKQQQVENYRLQLNKFGIAVDELKVKIGVGLLPVLTRMSEWFGRGVDAIASGLARFSAAIRSNLGGLEAMATGAKSADEAISKLDEDWSKFKPMGGGVGPPVPGSGAETFKTKPTGEADLMEILRNRLKAQQDAFDNMKEMQGSWQTWSEAQTEAFWVNVLATEKLNQKQRLAAENEMYNARRKVQQEAYAEYIKGLDTERAALGDNIAAKIALDQQYYDKAVGDNGALDTRTQELYRKLLEDEKAYRKQQAALAQDALKFNLDVNKLELSGEEAALKQKVALRQISTEQEYQEELKLEDRMHALAAQEISNELLRDDLTLLQRQQLNEKLVVLEIEHQQKIAAIKRQAELEQNKDAQQAMTDFTNDFATAIASVVDGTTSLKNAFDNFFRSLDKQLSQIAANQIAKSLFGAGTQGGAGLSSIFGNIFGTGNAGGIAGGGTPQGGLGGAIQGLLSSIFGSNSPQTAATTANTTATLANTTALGAFSLSQGGGISSLFGAGSSPVGFAVGTPYVPQDTLAYLHRGEAVIPAAYNKTGAGISGAGNLQVHNHFAISGPIDSRTQDQIASTAAIAVRRAQYRNL